MVVTLTSHQALRQPVCLNPDYLPSQPLYGTVATNQSQGLGWQLAATPFDLEPEQIEQLQALGPALWHFSQALNQLYFESLAGRAPAFVASWLNTGKPADLLQFSQQKRLRQQLPPNDSARLTADRHRVLAVRNRRRPRWHGIFGRAVASLSTKWLSKPDDPSRRLCSHVCRHLARRLPIHGQATHCVRCSGWC
jgi:hypothetical protein